MRSCASLLVAVLVVAAGLSTPEARNAKCFAGATSDCVNCQQRGTCDDLGTITPADICPPGQACVQEDLSVSLCKPNGNVTGCDCDGLPSGCDAYNYDLQIFCLNDSQTSEISFTIGADCSKDINQTCKSGQCVNQTDDPCYDISTTEFRVQAPGCATGYFCSLEEALRSRTQRCDVGMYFSLERSVCEPVPPNPCTGCGYEKCPVITDCSKYVDCTSGTAQNEGSCGDQFFNPESRLCETEQSGICTKYIGCTFDSSTATSTPTSPSTPTSTSSPTDSTSTSSPTDSTSTTTTTGPSTTTTSNPAACTAADVNKSYSDDTDCKKFYAYRLTPATAGYVESTCPGTYVFNPATGYCDLPANVPGCDVPAET